jgi:hypothetical protein
MAADAGHVAGSVTSGLNMHQARHTFATELRHVAGIDAAPRALGHSDLSTTLGIYGHFDGTDLHDAMKAQADWVAEQDDQRPLVPRERPAKSPVVVGLYGDGGCDQCETTSKSAHLDRRLLPDCYQPQVCFGGISEQS